MTSLTTPDREELAREVLAEHTIGKDNIGCVLNGGSCYHPTGRVLAAMLAFADRLTPPAEMAKRVEALEAAIQRHRDNIWGGGEVDHPEDVELYAALGEG